MTIVFFILGGDGKVQEFSESYSILECQDNNIHQKTFEFKELSFVQFILFGSNKAFYGIASVFYTIMYL